MGEQGTRGGGRASGGAGVQAGSTVASQGAEAVITGNVGPNAHKVLVAANIAIYQAGNGISASDALAALKCSHLVEVEAPTMSGHWA
jgi:predicted Fe-Mo cluster-binding NifX family protein